MGKTKTTTNSTPPPLDATWKLIRDKKDDGSTIHVTTIPAQSNKDYDSIKVTFAPPLFGVTQAYGHFVKGGKIVLIYGCNGGSSIALQGKVTRLDVTKDRKTKKKGIVGKIKGVYSHSEIGIMQPGEWDGNTPP